LTLPSHDDLLDSFLARLTHEPDATRPCKIFSRAHQETRTYGYAVDHVE
jgi:hypothetical protein